MPPSLAGAATRVRPTPASDGHNIAGPLADVRGPAGLTRAIAAAIRTEIEQNLEVATVEERIAATVTELPARTGRSEATFISGDAWPSAGQASPFRHLTVGTERKKSSQNELPARSLSTRIRRMSYETTDLARTGRRLN